MHYFLKTEAEGNFRNIPICLFEYCTGLRPVLEYVAPLGLEDSRFFWPSLRAAKRGQVQRSVDRVSQRCHAYTAYMTVVKVRYLLPPRLTPPLLRPATLSSLRVKRVSCNF